MNTRSYALPALSALSIVTTATGCSKVDPLVGDWIGNKMAQTYLYADGTSYVYTYNLPQVTDSAEYTSTFGITMALSEQYTGTLVMYNNYAYSNGTSSSENYNYTLVGARTERGIWAISMTGTDMTLALTCTADQELDTVHCDSAPIMDAGDSMTYAFDFNRAVAE